MASAGYDSTLSELQNLFGGFSQTYVALFARVGEFLTRLNDLGPERMAALYNNDQEAIAQAMAWIAAVQTIDLFATTQSSNVAATDNTAGGSSTTVSVPAGGYAVISSDPVVISILKEVGIDKSPAIRSPSRMSNV